MQTPLIELSGITKSYGPVSALKGVNMTLYENEIIGLIGDNGAGKSTLIKILAGVEKFDSGKMSCFGQSIRAKNYCVSTARRMGIETVFQAKSLGESQPIWRNFFMGRHLHNSLGLIRVGHEKKESMRVLTKIIGLRGVGISVNAPVSVLSGGERQGLAIGRAMYFDAKAVIMDEPTTALAVKEAEKVLGFVKDLKAQGKSAIFVSHNLYHMYDVADRFLFFQHGKISSELRKEDATPKILIDTLMGCS